MVLAVSNSVHSLVFGRPSLFPPWRKLSFRSSNETIMTDTTVKRKWGVKDNVELLALFESGAVDVRDSSKDYIESVRVKYFGWTLYRNFVAAYRKKAKEYIVNLKLQGGRGK
jgi:hypothetical protein